MKTKKLLIGSLTLNALLLGIGIYLVQLDLCELSSTPPLIICISHAQNGAAEPAVASAPSATNAFERGNWRPIESESYAHYVARLRALGCTDKSIGDIVSADVNEMFRRRSAKDVYTATSFAP